MRVLQGEEEKQAKKFMEQAVNIAQQATCERSQCGSIIIKDGEPIGKGYNSPPKNLEDQRRCSCEKQSYHRKVVDKTCCMHAEQRAIMDALIHNPQKIMGSTLYFIRLQEGIKAYAGKPYCTLCSKMALDAGIKEFVLWHKEGISAYQTEEYNTLSYQYEEE